MQTSLELKFLELNEFAVITCRKFQIDWLCRFHVLWFLIVTSITSFLCLGKLIILANNCPPLRKSEIEYYAMLGKVSVHHFHGSKFVSSFRTIYVLCDSICIHLHVTVFPWYSLVLYVLLCLRFQTMLILELPAASTTGCAASASSTLVRRYRHHLHIFSSMAPSEVLNIFASFPVSGDSDIINTTPASQWRSFYLFSWDVGFRRAYMANGCFLVIFSCNFAMLSWDLPYR